LVIGLLFWHFEIGENELMKKALLSAVLVAALCIPALGGNQGGNGQGGNGQGGSNGYHNVPGPIVGAGLPIIAAGYGVYWLIRRRRQTPGKGR
jgi:hypothetical protein